MPRPPIKIKGFERLQRQFDNLEKKAAKRVLNKSMRRATAVILKTVRASTPKDEGLLRKMQTSKIGGKGLRKFGVVGADVSKLEAAAAGQEGMPGYRPSNIDWLVENGHVTPEGKFVPPSGHMRRAADEAIPRAEKVFVDTAELEIEREAMKT